MSTCLIIWLVTTCCFVILSVPRPSMCAIVNTVYTIDTLVIMDQQAFNSWLSREPVTSSTSQREADAKDKVKQYLSLIIHQVNSDMETIALGQNDWTVQLSVAEFKIGVNPLSGIANILTNAVSQSTALATLQTWVQFNKYNTQFDYVILMTGYDLRGSLDLGYEAKGIANVGTICEQDGSSIAIVEDRSGGFQSSNIVSHEFGHSLGVLHDGDFPNEACPASGRYIMSIGDQIVLPNNLLNPWKFSSCSEQAIRNHVINNTLINFPDCLKNEATPDSKFKATDGVLAGSVYDWSSQCKQLLGSSSGVCWGGNFGQPEDICTSMYCLDTSPGVSHGSSCLQHRAAEGTSCSSGKICQRGRCIATSEAPQLSECAFGDSTRLFGGKLCKEYIASSPQSCYFDDVRESCCKSCQQIQTQSQVCPYGDKQTGCDRNICEHIGHDGTRFEELCCGTCSYDVIKPCADVARIDGLRCQDRIRLHGLQACYNTTVAYHCCASCVAIRVNITGCEYGDTVTSGCQNVDESSCQNNLKSQCCGSCTKKDFNNSSSPLPGLIFCILLPLILIVLFYR